MSTCLLREEVSGVGSVSEALTACRRRDPEALRNGDAHRASVPDQYAAEHSTLAGQPLPRPQACLVFTCNGRGEELHGEADAESRALATALPGVPFAGAFVGGEFGPSAGSLANVNDVHQFSCALAMLGCSE